MVVIKAITSKFTMDAWIIQYLYIEPHISQDFLGYVYFLVDKK